MKSASSPPLISVQTFWASVFADGKFGALCALASDFVFYRVDLDGSRVEKEEGLSECQKYPREREL